MGFAERLATYEDLVALPEGDRAEILGGRVEGQPAPLPMHSRAQGALRRFIGGPYDDDDGFGGPGGWWTLLEVDVRFGPHDVVRPDLSGWRRDRLPHPWSERPIDVRPDWICELLSPSKVAVDRVVKRRLYANGRVSHYWLLDPLERTLETVRLEGGVWIDAGTFDDQAPVRAEPFGDVELDLSRIFPPTGTGRESPV